MRGRGARNFCLHDSLACVAHCKLKSRSSDGTCLLVLEPLEAQELQTFLTRFDLSLCTPELSTDSAPNTRLKLRELTSVSLMERSVAAMRF